MYTSKEIYHVTLAAIPGIPLIKKGDDLGRIIVECLENAGLTPQNGDAVVVTSKIVQKQRGDWFHSRRSHHPRKPRR